MFCVAATPLGASDDAANGCPQSDLLTSRLRIVVLALGSRF